jgi:hypothetical protein
VIGRLKPGVDVAKVRGESRCRAARRGYRTRTRSRGRRPTRCTSRVGHAPRSCSAGAVGFVLLIACRASRTCCWHAPPPPARDRRAARAWASAPASAPAADRGACRCRCWGNHRVLLTVRAAGAPGVAAGRRARGRGEGGVVARRHRGAAVAGLVRDRPGLARSTSPRPLKGSGQARRPGPAPRTQRPVIAEVRWRSCLPSSAGLPRNFTACCTPTPAARRAW